MANGKHVVGKSQSGKLSDRWYDSNAIVSSFFVSGARGTIEDF